MNYSYLLFNLLGYNKVDIKSISKNEDITWNIIVENPNFRWDYGYISKNPNITWDIVKSNPDKDWSFATLCTNPSISLDIILSNPYFNWGYYFQSRDDVTWDVIKANPDIQWDYSQLGHKPSITWDIIQANPDKNWNYENISKNPNITWDIIQANPDKEWNYTCLSQNPNITWDIVQTNPDKNWKYNSMWKNPNITPDIIESNPDKKWISTRFFTSSDFVSKLKPTEQHAFILEGIKNWFKQSTHLPNWRNTDENYNPDNEGYGCWRRGIIHRSIVRGRPGVKVAIFDISRGGHSAAPKIQHLFRRWIKNVKLEMISIILHNIEYEVALPSELCCYILKYSV
jgi:hypothetical protein